MGKWEKLKQWLKDENKTGRLEYEYFSDVLLEILNKMQELEAEET